MSSLFKPIYTSDENLPEGNSEKDIDQDLEPLAYLRFIRYARPLAYTNEIGEAFRNVLPKLVTPAYILSFGYVGADIGVKTYQKYQQNLNTNEALITATDATLWHGMASIGIPSAIVHSTVKYSPKLFEMGNFSPKVRAMGPVGLGLAIIPFIIEPVDELTDFVMDNTFRKLVGE